MVAFALSVVLTLSGCNISVDPLPVGAVLRLGDTRFRAAGEIRHLRFSPDGTEVLGWIKGYNGRMQGVAWETATGRTIPHRDRDSQPLSSGEAKRPIAPWDDGFTPAVRLGGDRIITAGPGPAGRVWDASTGRQLAALSGHSGLVTAVAVSNDGKRIATGSADGLVKLWDADTFHPISVLGGHTGAVRTIRVAGNGMRAVTVGEDKSVRIWDLKNGKELRGFHASGIVELTPDGAAVVLSVAEGAMVRDVLTGLQVVPNDPPEPPAPKFLEWLGWHGLPLALSPDGRMLVAGHADGTIGIYETATAQCRRMLVGHLSCCRAMAFTPDGGRLLTAGADHTVLVWAVRLQDLPMTEAIRNERRAGQLWSMMAAGSADAAYQAMARFAAEPPAAVKMVRLRLQSGSSESHPKDRLAIARAVELLECLDTYEARELLEELASGPPGSPVTQEAARALEHHGGKR